MKHFPFFHENLSVLALHLFSYSSHNLSKYCVTVWLFPAILKLPWGGPISFLPYTEPSCLESPKHLLAWIENAVSLSHRLGRVKTCHGHSSSSWRTTPKIPSSLCNFEKKKWSPSFAYIRRHLREIPWVSLLIHLLKDAGGHVFSDSLLPTLSTNL